jgi:uncharacterized membrane protein YqaE (UPF0057 family)
VVFLCLKHCQARVKLMNIYLMALLAVVLPPLAVYLNAGITSQFWINLLLTMLGFVPGAVHALCVVISNHRTQ